MILNLDGITIELPGDADVQILEDGRRVVIIPRGTEKVVQEKIRVVEIPGPPQEVIRVVEVEKPCKLNHYPNHHPTWPNTWIGGVVSTTTTGMKLGNDITGNIS